jgi:hypothetical protein
MLLREGKTQKEQVLIHLRGKGFINSIIAINYYGITRLSSIIHQLRKEGYNITTENVVFKNRFGNSSFYGVYKIIES